ncbi:MAG: asparagine synthase (glutamine-hydrolyzing) [Steroidobacteraceae bacterium]
MCGIAGMVSQKTSTDSRWLEAARRSLSHRGPDSEGSWRSADGCAAFAHTRLSIIDLSPCGAQPMLDDSGLRCIVFNGEIYNFLELRAELAALGYPFRSKSDTEVILAAYREWGDGCVERLDGMFAFALYDAEARQLFMARDRAGEKPLYYRLSEGALSFASELKALMQDPSLERRIDPSALDCYLYMGFVPGERCILQGCNKLPPAHALRFDLESGQLRVWRYWSAPCGPAADDCDEAELLEELEALLARAVQRQMVADVPVGILLSGGIDSSLVTAMAARTGARLRTYTARFPEASEYDETEHARLIARHFSTDHTELSVGRPSVDIMPILARQFDEPIVDSSMIPTYLICRSVHEHCKVALGGDGGDELFGGYRHYNRLLWLRDQVAWIPRPVRSAAALPAGAMLPVGFKGRNWLQAVSCDFEHGVPLIASYFDRPMRQRLLRWKWSPRPSAEEIREQRTHFSGDLLERASRVDLENYLPEDILTKVDRASMLSSIEIRAPLLDRAMLEFAYGRVPSHLKATSTSRKVLLKRLASRVLPSQFDAVRKHGFSIPLGRWLAGGEWSGSFREVLLGPRSDLFDRQTIAQLLRGQERGRNNCERLFALTIFELWRQHYRASM